MNKMELDRKEVLIRKHSDHLQQWLSILEPQHGMQHASPNKMASAGAQGVGPLASLEQTTSNIGAADQKR